MSWEKMKITIEKNKIFYNMENEGKEMEKCPLPVNICWRGIVEIKGKLIKTPNFHWEVHGIDIPDEESPQVWLRGLADVRTSNNKTLDTVYYNKDIFITRRPTSGKNFYIHIRFLHGGAEDLIKKKESYIISVAEELKDKKTDFRQGHLKGKIVSQDIAPPDNFPKKLALKGKRARILNHEFIGNELQYIIYERKMVLYTIFDFYVVSPDHLSEGLKLPNGTYFFYHPEPSD